MATKKATEKIVKEPDTQTQVTEIIKEVIKVVEVEKPQLEGFELYSRLRDTGYFPGGSGQYLDDQYSLDKVYVPTAQEVISFFAGDPDKWDELRDGIIRTYIEIHERED